MHSLDIVLPFTCCSMEEFVAQFGDVSLLPEDGSSSEILGRQVGFTGRTPEAGLPATNVLGLLPVCERKCRFQVVCFYTSDNEYSQHAERLEASLIEQEIEYSLQPIKSLGAWELNCAYKARFIREKWAQSDIPVVWLDADATVEADPIVFGQISADFAMHKWDGAWCVFQPIVDAISG